ncbi:RNA helicase [Cyanobium sp. ATX 6A2]|uniref:RNA helicase n=1 Tax=Cyanobium sp. ATX 6A2 TaxID=2823700 RepID=UPI0020CBFE3D|nr:RNA helicase [Cyanobium sp. ATX 6A2]MCP9887611.1 RNA helicase [Cyanobium sp. ATX 6A2]
MYDRRPDVQRPAAEPRRGSEPLEQGFDRLVSAGRQLVDGVSGARPGSRSSQRPQRPAGGAPAGPGRPRLGELGRWVEDKLDWILEDEDDWREPWQEPRPGRLAQSRRLPAGPAPSPAPQSPAPPAGGSGRRPLEAVSRRGERRRPAVPSPPLSPSPAADAWPDDSSFARPRWQRPPKQPGRAPDLGAEAARDGAERRQEPARPLPRSSRRRPG